MTEYTTAKPKRSAVYKQISAKLRAPDPDKPGYLGVMRRVSEALKAESNNVMKTVNVLLVLMDGEREENLELIDQLTAAEADEITLKIVEIITPKN